MNISMADAVEEIRQVKSDCLDLLSKLRGLCPPGGDGVYPEMFRLMAVPMLYAAWERCFTLCHSIGLRRVRAIHRSYGALPTVQRALWLQQQGFYKSYLSRVRSGDYSLGGSQRHSRGAFDALSQFLEELESWTGQEVESNTATQALVMTFSNINPDVVRMNLRPLGPTAGWVFEGVDLERLHELVSRRNDIGHGGIVAPPGNREFTELWTYVETLIGSYCTAFAGWIELYTDG
jgi:hypothetical protein